jgi:hypothetical protein
MDRRAFLVRGGAAAATALWVPWASGCHDAGSDRGHGRDRDGRDGRDDGGFGNDADLAVSTLDATVITATTAAAAGNSYVRLTDGPGWPTRRSGGFWDLNVELVLDAPFDLAAAGLG